jgi:hypothetical protein
MKRNNKGLGAVVVLLSMLVVTAVGFMGYYVWNSQQDKNKNTVVSNTENITKSSENTSQESTQEFLDVKEWDIKIPVDDTVRGLSYHTNAGVDGGYVFTSDELSALTSECDSSSVILVRGKATDIVPNETSSTEGLTFKEAYTSTEYDQYPDSPRGIKLSIGDYYYVYPAIAAAYCTNDEEQNIKEQAAITKIVTVVKKAVSN